MQGDKPLSGVLASCLHSYSRVSGRTIASFQLRKTLGNMVRSGRLQVFTRTRSGKCGSSLLKTSGGWQNFSAKFSLF